MEKIHPTTVVDMETILIPTISQEVLRWFLDPSNWFLRDLVHPTLRHWRRCPKVISLISGWSLKLERGLTLQKWNQLNNCRAKFSPTFFEHIVDSVAFVSLRYSVLNEKRILKMLDTPFVWDTRGYNEGGGFGGSWSLLIAYLLECKIGHPQTVGPLVVDGSCFLEHVFCGSWRNRNLYRDKKTMQNLWMVERSFHLKVWEKKSPNDLGFV